MQTERQATKYKTRQVYMQHCLHGLNNLASDVNYFGYNYEEVEMNGLWFISHV